MFQRMPVLDRTPQAQAALRDAWVDLLLNCLHLHPKRPSLFWSETLPSRPSSPLLRQSPVESEEVESIIITKRRGSDKEENVDDEEDVIDDVLAAEKTEQLLGTKDGIAMDDRWGWSYDQCYWCSSEVCLVQ